MMDRSPLIRVDPPRPWPAPPPRGEELRHVRQPEFPDDESWWDVAKDWGGVLVVAAILLLMLAVAR